MASANVIKQVLLVAAGGAAGSVLRFLTAAFVNRFTLGSFPMGTFIVNITGCFIAGLFAGWISQYFSNSENMRLLLITGFCGGYTTFSAFALENIRLLQGGSPVTGVAYIILSLLVGLLAVGLGLSLSK